MALIQALGAKTGLNLKSDSRVRLQSVLWSLLERRVFESVEDCVRHVLEAPEDDPIRQQLIHAVAISETHFMRESRALEFLEKQVFCGSTTADRTSARFRIWSAGCSTGEEPYSLALILHRMHAQQARQRFSILATDVDMISLRKAQEGKYGSWSFRQTPPWAIEALVACAGGKRQVLFPPP